MASIQHPYLYTSSEQRTRDSRWPRRKPVSPVKYKTRSQGAVETAMAADCSLPGFQDVVRQLYFMTLRSLEGYREIENLTANPDTLNYISVVAAQREAQLASLAQLSEKLSRNLEQGKIVCSEEDELASQEMRLSWVRAIWSFEQEEIGRFSEFVDLAERTLEDAFLYSANAYSHTKVAEIFHQIAMSICAARERWEELCQQLVYAQQ